MNINLTNCFMFSLLTNKPIKQLIVACAMTLPTLAAHAEPQIEVMHWWSRGGESRAMQVLKDEFELRGGTWYDVAGDDQISVLNRAVSRMAKGYAPSLVQWNSGWEVSQIRKLGLLNHIDPKVIDSLENQFTSNVMDMVMVDGELVAIPVNVHSENWFWFKPKNFHQNAENVMRSWPEFLKFAQKRHEEGVVTLAIGDEPWQRRILFNNILLGFAGQTLFQEVYNDLNPSSLVDMRFSQAVQTFKQLKTYSHSFGKGQWEQQIAAVASNKALVATTGDWAKGEFRNIGLQLGRDYDCVPSPGTSSNIILAMDVFALGQVNNPAEQQGQELFLDVVTDRAVSETFNYLKGSLSSLSGTDVSTLDQCSQIAYKTLETRGKAIKPHASIGDRGFLARIDHLITQLWAEDIPTDQWVTAFQTLLQEERDKRSAGDQLAKTEQQP